MNEREERREVREALAAADRALMSLSRAGEKLNSAENWGIWDMLGGGLFATLFKHSRIDDAKQAMEEARSNLRALKKELSDIEVPSGFQVDIDGFLTFADYFFDGLIADWMVQSRLNKASGQIEEAERQVHDIKRDLERWLLRLGDEEA